MEIDISNYASRVANVLCEEASVIRAALTAPHILYKPELKPDGDQWCALLGADLMVGVVGFGDTPAHAMAAFDKAWWKEKTPDVRLLEHQIKEEEEREEEINNGQFGVGA